MKSMYCPEHDITNDLITNNTLSIILVILLCVLTKVDLRYSIEFYILPDDLHWSRRHLFFVTGTLCVLRTRDASAIHLPCCLLPADSEWAESGSDIPPSLGPGPASRCTMPLPGAADSHDHHDHDRVSSMETQPLTGEDDHVHYSHRTPWLRAFVMGATDGLVSVASVMVNIAPEPLSP